MKRLFGFALIVILTFSLFGCKSSSINSGNDIPTSSEPGMTGYVMNKDNGRILVISTEAQDFSATGGVNEFYDAIWFSKAPKEIKLGEKVKVWFDVVAESYPGQSEAKKIEVIPSIRPAGANLTEEEALYKALTSDEVNKDQVLVVKSIEFDQQALQWNIDLKDTFEDKTYNIKISDK